MSPAPKVPDAIFEQLAGLFHRGDLAAADALARRLLIHDPENSGLWNVLGLIALRRGELDLAVERLGEAWWRATHSNERKSCSTWRIK